MIGWQLNQFFNSGKIINKKEKQRGLIKKAHQLSGKSSIQDMESILVSAMTIFTNYQLPSVHPNEIKIALQKIEVSDALQKSIATWIKNVQKIQFSNEALDKSNHSFADSLKRILFRLIEEKGSL